MREMSLLGFVAHIAGFVAGVDEANHRGLELAARAVEAEAKLEIGTYQDAAPPFAGWAQLKDATKDDRVRLGFTENDPGLRTGDMRASIGHASSAEEAIVGSNDDKMVIFELGSANQLPRSVLGGALVRKTDEVLRLIGEGYVGALIGKDVHEGSIDLTP